jgi:hypothetical protein
MAFNFVCLSLFIIFSSLCQLSVVSICCMTLCQCRAYPFLLRLSCTSNTVLTVNLFRRSFVVLSFEFLVLFFYVASFIVVSWCYSNRWNLHCEPNPLGFTVWVKLKPRPENLRSMADTRTNANTKDMKMLGSGLLVSHR